MPRYSVSHGAVFKDASAITHAWTSLGSGNFAGRTRSFLINPKNPNIMYAGAANGGVWKSIDGGASWSSVSDSFSVLAIGALAMDPSNPDIIYAGTGESYAGHLGNGIFKSADAGATWTPLGRPAAAGPSIISSGWQSAPRTHCTYMRPRTPAST
jgi:hypothetical protein